MAVFHGTLDADFYTGTVADDQIFGHGGNDLLYGNSGDDYVDGGAGADRMYGDGGDDTYLVDDAGDVVEETGNDPDDLVLASIDYTLTGQVERLELLGLAAVGNGNGGNNAITGNGQNNVLRGYGGDDVLRGYGGDDVLSGGSGDDILFGKSGRDTLSGGAGDDMMDGGTGADRMVGHTGNDTYLVDDAGDVVEEIADGGYDLVRSNIDFVLPAHVEDLVLLGAGLTGEGNALDNRVTGTTGDNILSGGGGNDLLDGGLGNDVLDGGAGDDIMRGGVGNDIYRVDSANDVVVEENVTLTGGYDTVYSSITFRGTAGIDEVVLTGSADVDAWGATAVRITGNEGDNTLIAEANKTDMFGGDGNDVLRGNSFGQSLAGGNGDDRLIGGGSSASSRYDDLIGGAGADVFVFENKHDSYYISPVLAGGESGEFYTRIVDFSREDGDKIDLSLLDLTLVEGEVESLDEFSITSLSAWLSEDDPEQYFMKIQVAGNHTFTFDDFIV